MKGFGIQQQSLGVGLLSQRQVDRSMYIAKNYCIIYSEQHLILVGVCIKVRLIMLIHFYFLTD